MRREIIKAAEWQLRTYGLPGTAEKGRWRAVIDETLEELPPDKARLCRMRYFEAMAVPEILKTLPCSRPTYYAYRDEALYTLIAKAAREGLLKT